jgi:hypothetical protein
MIDGLERVKNVMGSEEQSGLSDSTIKDVLWNEYFNVESAVQYLVGSFSPI